MTDRSTFEMKQNKIERAKTLLLPYDFREKLESLDLSDLNEETRFYLKNYGIYNIKLNPEKFMLRMRIAGGRVSRKILHVLADTAQRYKLELLITARAQLELHGLAADNVLEVWELLQKADITTLQTLTDNFRNIVTDPYDGLEKNSQIETYAMIEQMQNIFLNRREWMGMLPRKFNTAICGTQSTHVSFFSNDLFFGLAEKDGMQGFNLYLGGKNSETAQHADMFVLPEDVPLMFEAVARAYRKYGLRGSRSKTRLYHLLEEIGLEVFAARIAEFYPKKISKGGTLQIQKNAPSAYRELKNGTYGYCCQSRFGVLDIKVLKAVLAYAEKEALALRVGTDQNLYLLGLKEKRVPFETIKGASNVTACAGSHYCALSLWDVKSDVSYLPLEKIEKYQIQIGFSGCLKGCGRHHHADIGLVGLRTNVFGETQKAARVFIGGIYSRCGSPARLIFPVVPLIYLKGLIEAVIEEFENSGENDFEAFSLHRLAPLSSGFVMLWFLSKLYLKEEIILEHIPEEKLYHQLRQQPGFPLFDEDEMYVKSIDAMKHALWDDVSAIHTS